MLSQRPMLLALALSLTMASVAAQLSCVGEDGAPVDWWLALKSPGTDKFGNTKYAYVDNTSKVKGGKYVWRRGTQINGTSDNPPADTLAPLFDPTTNDTIGYVIWNDEPAATHCETGCTSFVLGHSKGVLGLSSEGGFWLSHSVPKYPDNPIDSAFTGIHPSQTLNGQSFACISLTPDALETVSEQLQTANIYIYSPHTLPTGLKRQFSSTQKLLRSAPKKSGPVEAKAKTASVEIAATSGEAITVFVKSSTGKNGEPVRMWEDLVEPGLASGMLVQTWPEGRTNDFPSYCGEPESEFASMTISNISIPQAKLEWPTRKGKYRDHSKWAVTAADDESEGVFCEGDNNRAETQDFRGGTAICFTANPALHKAVADTIVGVAPCPASSDLPAT